MNIEEIIKANTAALIENTSAIRELLVAGDFSEQKLEIVKQKSEINKILAASPKTVKIKSATEPATEPVTEPVIDTAKAYAIATLAKVKAEFAAVKEAITEDINTDAVIASIIEAFKNKMTDAVDAERKNFLKEQYSALRTKYDLGSNDKLVVLKPTPEKLVGLLADIEAL